MSSETQETKIIDKVLSIRIGVVMTVIAATMTVLGYFNTPTVANSTDIGLIKQEIQNLKDNHIHTLQMDVTEIHDRMDKIEDTVVEEGTELKIQLAELKTILNERLPVR